MIDLPNRHEEAWRWADLRHARDQPEAPPPANDALPDVAQRWLDAPGERRLFVAGHAVGHETDLPDPDRRLPGHPLADLAAASAKAGAIIDIGEGEDGGTVQHLHVGTTGAAHSVTRLRLAPGARLTLIEIFADERRDHWLNHRLDAELGAGAALTRIVRVVAGHGLVSERGHFRLAAGAQLRQLLVATAASTMRAETHVDLDGAGADATVNGILLGDGGAALDTLTRLCHRVPDTVSRQTFRLVAAGQSQVSIAGGISVARHAQKTDAEQSLKALVLNRTAAANLKPELEIYADDVKCAHGCTVGELDKAALFYLESRGIPPTEASALLTQAFVADALAILGDDRLRDTTERETKAWLEQRT